MKEEELEKRLFSINSASDFNNLALAIFRYQHKHVAVYRQFCMALNRNYKDIQTVEEIPFLPIQFFKSHKIIAEHAQPKTIFTSSGTTGNQTSKHFVASPKLYEKTFLKAFEEFYGELSEYVVLALLPSYLERTGSSLIYMVKTFIERSNHSQSGFYLNNHVDLAQKLTDLDTSGHKILLIGVSFALLDLVEQYSFSLDHTVIMETGGMKGRRKELTRAELHQKLCKGFGVEKIHSEYGMTELLSQAYSVGNGIFRCPTTMQIEIREPEDPFQILPTNKTGGINIIDLANLYSCSFIATQDLGKINPSGHFEVLGRFDNSDIRGCNLMLMN